MTTEPSRVEPTTTTGEPSQAAMERAREVAPPCAKCFGRGRVPKWQCLPMKCGACKGTGKDSKVVKAIARAIDLHAAAAVQEERERLDAEFAEWKRGLEMKAASRVEEALFGLTGDDCPEFKRGEVRGLKRMRSLVLGEFRDGIRDPEEIASAMSGLLDRYTSGSAEDGEGKAQNPNPSQQPTTGTGGER